jgi:hypothetical protein
MKANLFSVLYESFTLEEREKFRLFLHSPYFNKSGTAIRLFEIHATHGGEEMNRENVWANLYPDKALAENQLRKHYSDLHRLAREFMAVEEFAKSGRSQSLNRLKRHIRSLSPDRLRKELDAARKELMADASDYPDSDCYWHASKLDEFEYYLNAHERKAVPNLNQAVKSLDAAYLLSKLKFLCEIASFRNVFHFEQDFALESEVVLLASKPPFSAYLLIGIYLQVYHLFESHHQFTHQGGLAQSALLSDFDRLLVVLGQRYASIALEELQTIENYLQNICIRRIALSDHPFEEKLDQLYEFRLASGSIFVNGWLRTEDYKNRVSLLLKLKRFEQAWEFIHAYSEKILPEFRTVAVQFNLGSYYFYSGDYGKMRRALVVVLNQDAFYLLDSKALMIKAYFLEQEIDALKLQLESLKAYLWRNTRLPSARILIHKNRYRFFEKLYRLMESKVRKTPRIEKLRAEIMACQPLLDQEFLLDLLGRWQAGAGNVQPRPADL